jgi:ligand-binding sensor domain-containing protein
MWFYYQNQHQASFFDGQTWSQLDEFSGMNGQVLDTAIDQRGYIWFATDHGLNVWDGLTMRSFDSEDIGLPTNRFQALLAQDGSLWVGTDRGLLRYNRFTWELVLPGISVQTIAQESSGDLLLGTNQGLIHYQNGQSFLWIINMGEESYLSPNITKVVIDKRGNTWAGSVGDGLFFFNGHTWQHFTTANGLPANTIQAMVVDHLGGVWIAAATGAGGGALMRYIP